MPQNGTARTVKKLFSRQTAVAIDIEADPSIIWTLLTQASDVPRWNSTIVSMEGDIALGEKVRLVSTLDPKRTFNLKIKELEPESRMVWGDGMGKRVFTLEPLGEGKTRFSMSEKIGGPLFPLFSGMIPSFDEAFEAYAADLKKEAEAIQRAGS